MKIFMCHTANSHYTVRALDSIGSKHQIHLMDGSFHEEMLEWSGRNDHVTCLFFGNHQYKDGRYTSRLDPLAAIWNNLIEDIGDEEWAVHVGPDICLDSPALMLLEQATKYAPEKVGLILCGCPTDPRGSFNVFAVRTATWKHLHGFDEGYSPCGGEDDDFHLRLCRDGCNWMAIPLPMHHMDMGHKTRTDRRDKELRAANHAHFLKKNGIKLGGREFHAEVNARRVG